MAPTPRSNHRSASPFETAVGFSRAVRVGDRIEVSGTAPIGPDGKAVQGSAFEQATRCFAIIREAVEALGGQMGDVVRTRMFLARREDWEEVGRAHGDAFRGIDPAATMVISALLDETWAVEIEATAVVGSALANPGK